MIMVLSHPDFRTERHTARIGDFSAANENCAESFMKVDDTAENDPSDTISSGQEMIVDIALRGHRSLVKLIVRGDRGEIETYSCESMPIERQRQFLQSLVDNMSAGGQTRYNGCHVRQASKYCQGSFQFDASAETEKGDEFRQCAYSTDSSNGGRTLSDMEDRGDYSPQKNRRKRARKFSWRSTRVTRRPRRRSIETFPVEDCSHRLKVGDDKACSLFYRRVLTDAQQTVCKKLAKWWIKAINPNKQTNNPYAGGPGKKPNWWPLTPPNNAVGEDTKGTLENGFVRHKEPDHLSKSERLILLPHILIQIVDPCNSTQFNSINATKLEQISLDSISNESTDKDKHESWRRFVIEIFRVAKMQERYKRGEIDDTTDTPVRPSYDSWRHKGSTDEAEEDSQSDDVYIDEEDMGNLSTAESRSEQGSLPPDQIQPQPLRDVIKQDYASYVHDARFLPHRQNGTNDQLLYRRVDDVPNLMPNQPPYNAPTPPLPRSYQQPNLMLQEPFRRHSDTSDRFSNPSSLLSNFLSSTTNMAHTTNLQYQTIHPVFPLPATSNSQNGSVLPVPLSAPVTRPPADIPHFPAFHDTGLFPRSNATFQASVRDPFLSSHGNVQQFLQQQQNFQDYLQNQDYGHNASKMHVLNLNNAIRPEFTYDQENTSNASRPEFGFEVKQECSLEPGTFDLDEMANGGSNVHSEHVRL